MAKHSIHFATGPATVANLQPCLARAMLERVDLTWRGKLSRSKIIDKAIEYGAQASVAAMRQTVPALPVATGVTDADRLRAAMARLGLGNAALGALIGVSRDVVKNGVRGLAMGPALRAWLAEQEP